MTVIKFVKAIHLIHATDIFWESLLDKTDPDDVAFAALISRGMLFLEKHGHILAKKNFFTTLLEDGSPYTIKLVKDLIDHPPLIEFRINWRKVGAFRSVCAEINGELIFFSAVVKQDIQSEGFNIIVAEAERLLPSVIANIKDYVH
jgi:hypothetical protein